MPNGKHPIGVDPKALDLLSKPPARRKKGIRPDPVQELQRRLTEVEEQHNRQRDQDLKRIADLEKQVKELEQQVKTISVHNAV